MHGREKRAAANAKGRKNASSDEEYISEPEGPSGSEDEADGAKDPFFQHEDDPFNDPFFQVRYTPALGCSLGSNALRCEDQFSSQVSLQANGQNLCQSI